MTLTRRQRGITALATVLTLVISISALVGAVTGYWEMFIGVSIGLGISAVILGLMSVIYDWVSRGEP